jgi:glycosyltransferase involved in cell wall biosynthesis
MNAFPEGRRPITILHVFSTFAVGGPQTRFATIADRLGPKYRHLIASMSGRTEAASLLTDRVRFELVEFRNTPANPLANAFRFAGELRRIRPDLLVTYNWGALEWALGNLVGPRLPHVHIEDGFGPDEARRRLARRVWLRRVALLGTGTVVVPSRNLERIARREWLLPARKILYLPNGVEIARFAAELPESEWAFAKKPGELAVGTCAALRPEKNLKRLIRAFAACGAANCRLVICGDGPERPGLERAAEAAGIADRITFTGYLAKPETVLAGCDLFAMSSDTEQMPYGLLEAMAAGLPAVSTDVGDIKSIVAEPNRPFIVPVSDEAQLSQALGRLLGSSELRARLGQANRIKAESEFALETMIAAYDRLFEGAATGSSVIV